MGIWGPIMVLRGGLVGGVFFHTMDAGLKRSRISVESYVVVRAMPTLRKDRLLLQFSGLVYVATEILEHL